VVVAIANSQALWTVGVARYVDIDGRLLHVWRPTLPTGPRHRWVLDPWGAPQPSTFWRREAFERFGPFRQDMHYVFDIEFGLRLVLAGELPTLVDRELAVRVEHEEAKSADRRNFDREEGVLVETFSGVLTPPERRRLALAHAGKR